MHLQPIFSAKEALPLFPVPAPTALTSRTPKKDPACSRAHLAPTQTQPKLSQPAR